MTGREKPGGLMMRSVSRLRMNQRRLASLLVLGTTLLLSSPLLPAQAQPNLRSTFPGRRVGGATRGECSARLIAHLVPSSSVFAPGEVGLLGILEGPSSNARPIQISFRPEGSAGGSPSEVTSIPAAGAGIVLFKAPKLQAPVRWESTYQCDGGAPSDDPLAFVSAGSPPALSLLIQEPTHEDKLIQQALQKLHKACGNSVSRADVASSFGLADVFNDDWPAELTVRCPN